MSIGAGKYGPCPTCGAMNMWHRQTCYRCHEPLYGGAAKRQTARPPAAKASGRGPLPRRRVPRHDVIIPNVSVDGDVVIPHRVTVRDVSPFGLRMSTQVACRLGARVQLHLPLDGKVYSVQGVVRHRCSVDPDTGHFYGYGVQFTEPNSALRQLVAKLSREPADLQ